MLKRNDPRTHRFYQNQPSSLGFIQFVFHNLSLDCGCSVNRMVLNWRCKLVNNLDLLLIGYVFHGVMGYASRTDGYRLTRVFIIVRNSP